jgi:hypothetical protein
VNFYIELCDIILLFYGWCLFFFGKDWLRFWEDKLHNQISLDIICWLMNVSFSTSVPHDITASAISFSSVVNVLIPCSPSFYSTLSSCPCSITYALHWQISFLFTSSLLVVYWLLCFDFIISHNHPNQSINQSMLDWSLCVLDCWCDLWGSSDYCVLMRKAESNIFLMFCVSVLCFRVIFNRSWIGMFSIVYLTYIKWRTE